MQFKRGLDPKVATNIGQAAIAPEIETLYELNPRNMSLNSATGKMEPSKMVIAPSRTPGVLKDLQEQNERAMNPRFLGFVDEKGNLKRLHKMRGLYVKFKDVTYQIPKK